MPFTEKHLKSLVKAAMDHNASDLHLREGETPCFRVRGDLIPVQTKIFTHQNMLDISKILLQNDHLFNNLDEHFEIDGGHTIEGLARMRFNFFRFQNKIGIILRTIKETIPSIDSLGLPKVLKSISERPRGLVLVTGATGSGKSTTLAAMINHINQKKPAHIITIEDPVEYIHEQVNSRITQREIGIDTKNFSDGLRNALRQDPDVILIGEMRDTETVSTALKAAETGHIVFSTVHTTDAIKTIGRIIAMFPVEEQKEVRKRLSENLYATIGQRMLKTKDKGVAVAMEIMITTPGIKDCIEGKDDMGRLIQIIRDGKNKSDIKSQSFDQHIMELYKAGTISRSTALESATSQSDFILSLEVE